MAKVKEEQPISLALRVTILRRFPCFQSLSQVQSEQLASLMQAYDLKKGEVIVNENELIDSIYFIVKGHAEVTRQSFIKKKPQQIPIALLSEGEAIGLNDTGFFSSTGKRTATVMALTRMQLLKIDLKDLYSFLQINQLEISMQQASSKMLLMSFIKQSLPFAKLSTDRLKWIAERIEEINVPGHTILFEQGDYGNKCYLIRRGSIEIYVEKEGIKHILATLKPPTLFGEATLITHSARNASAKTLEECELLILKHEHLFELLESEDKVAGMFMTLMVDRSRPTQNPIVTAHPQKTADGSDVAILKNPVNHTYFKLSQEGFYIWNQLDGNHTMQDITLNLAEKYKVFAPNVIAALISKLAQSDFIMNVAVENEYISGNTWMEWITKIKQYAEKRFAYGGADKWITQSYEKYIKYFFSKSGMILSAAVVCFGIYAFIRITPDILVFFQKQKAGLFLLLTLMPLSMFAVLLHELGHAYAVKFFDREVHYIGVGWNWIAPIAFTDTSDMWLSSRKPRIIVNLAGVYVDLVVAGFAAATTLLLHNPYVESVLWLFALYTYLSAFRMLSPLQDTDGYYILMDSVDKPHLRKSAVIWLIKSLPKIFLEPTKVLSQYAEVIYWVSCLIYVAITVYLTLTVLSFIFSIIGIHSNPYLGLSLSMLVVLFSMMSVLNELRRESDS